ncbi:hypothetical protein [Acinetobacter sp.]|uniref:hypothetical protein n=1 Tax=Acinetobacter sp. TaxID=472 RepID=UPI0012C86D18|nr:hypothetical protein [Acinetobacter sp.]MPS62135.1 hypothetical protein [Acinetobacter sp.]
MLFQTKFLNVVDYFGIRLYLPPFINWVATDKDGTITGYATKPIVNEQTECFSIVADSLEFYTTSGYIPLIRLDILQGDWRDSCLSIKQLLWKKNHDLFKERSEV